jgi:hypothetical protein
MAQEEILGEIDEFSRATSEMNQAQWALRLES